MNDRTLKFLNLWMISERDQKGRTLAFSDRMLLLGKNSTGKSRIMKSLTWVLGANPPKISAGDWDPNTIVALKTVFGDRTLLFMRQNKRTFCFEHNEIIASAESHSDWAKCFSNIFEYRLKLSRKVGDSQTQAPPDYLLIPTYVDQDGGWGEKWENFINLAQFRSWMPDTFQFYVGATTNEILELRQRHSEIKALRTQKQIDRDAQVAAFNRVISILPPEIPSIDFSQFQSEIELIGSLAKNMYEKQQKAKQKLQKLILDRKSIRAQLQLSMETRCELRADLIYLSKLDDASIECPTCGTEHTNSFHAKVDLIEDDEALSQLIQKLQSDLRKTTEDEKEVRTLLCTIENQMVEHQILLKTKKNEFTLGDLVDSKSKESLAEAQASLLQDLDTEIQSLDGQSRELDAKLKSLNSQARSREIKAFFLENRKELESFMNVPTSEQNTSINYHSRSHSGGSSGPRSILSHHLALIAASKKFADCPTFPLLVDTPQQSGQDAHNLSQMVKALTRSKYLPQLILAMEEIPKQLDTSDFDVVNFTELRGALTQSQFGEAYDVISPLFNQAELSLP